MSAFLEPRVVIPVPSGELGLSLHQWLGGGFPGQKGLNVSLPDSFEVTLDEFPTDAAGLDEVLGAVRAWLDEVGLDSLTVHSRGSSYELDRSGVG